MRALLSPYELDEWSPAAMAALMLFDAVATLRPELPESGTSAGSSRGVSASQSPALAALLDRWHWTGPLWKSGVLVPDANGSRVLDEARRAADGLQSEPRFAPIQRLAGKPWHDDAHRAGEALASDLIRQGADPSIHLPVVAALESLATRTGGVLCRGEGAGMFERLHRRVGSRALARFVLPTLIGGDGESMLSARERLAPQRERLLDALVGAFAMVTAEGNRHELLDAADAYALAFSTAFATVPPLRTAQADDGLRRTTLVVSIATMAPAPTLGATARLASIIGGRRHDRSLQAAASRQAEPSACPAAPEPITEPAHLLVATVKRVAWEPMPA